MRMFVRPFNADPPILHAAIRNGFALDGIVVDAHITKLTKASMKALRSAIPSSAKVLVDPVTHKIRKPFFRGKATSYGRLSYYLTDEFGQRAPTLREIAARVAKIAEGVIAAQDDFDVTAYTMPYLYVEADSFPSSAGSTFSVNRQLIEAAYGRRGKRAAALSICVGADCLAEPDALAEIEAYVRERKAPMVYLLLFDFQLGENPVLDQAVIAFLATLKGAGAKEIIYSHAPPWVYFLGPRGVTSFVTGINFLSTLKREFLDRDDGIGGIAHNYYIPRRFCRMTTDQAIDAINLGLIEACECAVCRVGVPDTQNAIREHYLHARSAECAALRASSAPAELLREWAEETEEFLVSVDANGLRIVGEAPQPTQWRGVLP